MSKLTFGRRIIYTDTPTITDQNVVAVLRKALGTHMANSYEINYLYNYYKGKQPILERVKVIRPEINNKSVENRANEIVSFKVGYLTGEPIQYIGRGADDAVSDKINTLNETMFGNDKAAQDKELAEWFFICGVSYRMVLPGNSDDLFNIYTLDPRQTFVVYHSGLGNYPVMGVKYVTLETGENVYSVYTDSMYYEIAADRVRVATAHVLQSIPIIEYPANMARLGAFEIVLTKLDALNLLESNRLDGVDQFIQSFLVFENCNISIDQFEALKELGAIKVSGEPGMPATVKPIVSELNQTQTQVLVDYIYQSVLTICGMPNRNATSGSTSDTGSAVILRAGWSDTEARARDTELIFKKSEKQFLKIVLRILRDLIALDLKMKDIDIKFTRRATDNILTKSQSLQNLLEAGVHPLEAIATSGLFNDATDVYKKSAAYLEKWLVKPAVVTPGNNKPNPTE